MTLPAVMCFSNVRWRSAFDRPKHLMHRFASRHRVFFVEEPIIDATYTELTKLAPNLWRVVPHLSESRTEAELLGLWKGQLALVRAEHRIDRPILWYYTPGAIPVSRGLARSLTVYDCMQDFSEHAGLVPELAAWERELMRKADLMFVGGHALYEAKKNLHRNVHAVPNSVDVEFFAQARTPGSIPPDQAGIPGPRIGYHGVLDEHVDWQLLDKLAELRPRWHFVLIGPVEGELSRLPQRPNLHYLGPKRYEQIPSYVSDWDAAILPLHKHTVNHVLDPNAALAYLAAGKPVISTPLPDVLEPYAHLGFVRIADDPEAFANAIDAELRGDHVTNEALRDGFLAHASWDGTWQRMYDMVLDAMIGGAPRSEPAEEDRPSSVHAGHH